MTTRDKILNETLTLFSENGFDGTSVEQIAEKVGIKAPSLYNHFKGKQDILNALIDTTDGKLMSKFEPVWMGLSASALLVGKK